MSAAAVIESAIAEAFHRAAIADRDLEPDAAHYADVIAATCPRWQLTPLQWFAGGAGMPTLDVARADGSRAVLKIALPGTLDTAAAVMAASDAYAAVLDWDQRVGALLVERLGEDLWQAAPGLADQGRIIVPLLARAWQVPRERGERRTPKAAGLLSILDDLGPRYGSDHRTALTLARRYARDLAPTEHASVVCHGDPHAGNVLRRGDGWALIDPEGFLGEPEYDLGVVARDACRDLVRVAAAGDDPAGWLRAECDALAASGSADPERVWRWAFVERVTTGLYLRWFGYADESRRFLDSAELLAARGA